MASEAARIEAQDAWTELRHAVRAEARRRGLTVADVADTLGRGRAALRTSLALRAPPSPALQAELRGWLSGAPVPTTSVARPPFQGPKPRSRMCAPSAKNMARGDIVSASITRPQWEYAVHRLPDHDWLAQVSCLNTRGVDGWDLVIVSGGVAYLKRVVL
jgi:hypothetical protein